MTRRGLLVGAALAALAGCGRDDPAHPRALVGDWGAKTRLMTARLSLRRDGTFVQNTTLQTGATTLTIVGEGTWRVEGEGEDRRLRFENRRVRADDRDITAKIPEAERVPRRRFALVQGGKALSLIEDDGRVGEYVRVTP